MVKQNNTVKNENNFGLTEDEVAFFERNNFVQTEKIVEYYKFFKKNGETESQIATTLRVFSVQEKIKVAESEYDSVVKKILEDLEKSSSLNIYSIPSLVSRLLVATEKESIITETFKSVKELMPKKERKTRTKSYTHLIFEINEPFFLKEDNKLLKEALEEEAIKADMKDLLVKGYAVTTLETMNIDDEVLALSNFVPNNAEKQTAKEMLVSRAVGILINENEKPTKDLSKFYEIDEVKYGRQDQGKLKINFSTDKAFKM